MADNATLKSQYLAQVEADLERNTKETERITADLEALQEQLSVLEQDHALLVGVQQTLAGASPAPGQDTAPADASADVPPAAVPRARKPKAAPRTPKAATARKAAPEGTVAKTAAEAGSPPAQHTLVELVAADLAGHSEPRSAAEITTALAQAHPGRRIQTTVVRNALETLVAKGQSLRSKQGRSVYYSLTQAAPAADTAAKSAVAAA